MKMLPLALQELRASPLLRPALLLLATSCLVGPLGCADEGLDTEYLPNGAAGAYYRPLGPTVRRGAAGTYGIDRTPGLNTGGTPGYSPGNAGAAGFSGAAGTLGLGSAGAASNAPDFGSAGTAGSGY